MPTGSGPPLVVAIVVTHAGPGDMLVRCVDSLVAAGGLHALIVVDNSPAANDGRANSGVDRGAGVGAGGTRVAGGVDEVVVVENWGFGAAVNAGIEAAGRYVATMGHGSSAHYAVLNDDVTVDAGWLAPLLAEITTSDRIGAVQPKMLFARADPPMINSVGVTLDGAGAGIDIGTGQHDGPKFSEAADIAMFSAGAVLLSAAFIDDVGGFDERYFLYYEDVDLALRGAERGWRFRCVPNSTVRHEVGASTSALGDEVRRLQERNRLWVAFRFGSATTVIGALWLSIRRLRHVPRRVHLRALAAGLGGVPRRLVERARCARSRR